MYKLSVLTAALMIVSGCSNMQTKSSDLQFSASSLPGDERQIDLCVVEAAKPEVEPEPVIQRPYVEDVYFITNTAIFNVETSIKVEEIYQTIVKLNSDKIILIGYTDTVGSSAANMALSMERVEKVKADLIARGISEQIISVDWHGESFLNVDTVDNVDEQKNRRVEIYVR